MFTNVSKCVVSKTITPHLLLQIVMQKFLSTSFHLLYFGLGLVPVGLYMLRMGPIRIHEIHTVVHRSVGEAKSLDTPVEPPFIRFDYGPWQCHIGNNELNYML